MDYPLAKVGVVGSNPIARSKIYRRKTLVSKGFSAKPRYACNENIAYVRLKHTKSEGRTHGSRLVREPSAGFRKCSALAWNMEIERVR
jgi:hypothetical protein